MRIFLSLTLALAASLALGPARADAALIVDQQFDAYADSGFNTGVFELGQTFTPTLTAIDFATFYFTAVDTSSGTFRADLREGVGGSVLASSNTVALHADDIPAFPDVTAIQFDFSSTVPLTPGTTYALTLVSTSGGNLFLAGMLGGGYSGGDAVFGGSLSTIDFLFSEGLHSPVPEPGSLLLLGVALGGVLLRRPRRHPSA